MKILFIISLFQLLVGCTTMAFDNTAEDVDLDKFLGKWYVVAGRTSFLEKGAHNSVENYTWNEKENRIDVAFTFNKDGFDGPEKSLPQKAWIHNSETNAHWKVQFFWPFKVDYLIVDLAEDYSWTAVGVPGQSYVWIMTKDWQVSDEKIAEIVERLKVKEYNTEDIVRIPQRWDTAPESKAGL